MIEYTQEQAQKAVKWIEETSTQYIEPSNQLAAAEFNDQPTVGEILVRVVRDLREALKETDGLLRMLGFDRGGTVRANIREALRKTGGDHV